MPKINVLEQSVAELIAAGEVVERPASVIKELVENSIDAGATRIAVEIKRGGIVFMRITDNGCGIEPADVPLAFVRHATSKISAADDLDKIATLGFRGEALAATSAVARVEIQTKVPGALSGTRYVIEGGCEIRNEEIGCPEGTTLTVRDLFYNTPARMKFLKKDVTEGNAVAAVLDRAALSHPEIAFQLIRDGKQTLKTPGDGELKSAIYCVLGREFAQSILPVRSEQDGVFVAGFTAKPIACRQSRSHQFVFLNGRFVRSGTVSAAVEQAYKNSAMVGKFPAFVLQLSVPFETVDVNVHPAKTEVRFSDEKRIFNAVYYAVKGAIEQTDTRPVIEPKSRVAKEFSPFATVTAEQYRQTVMPQVREPAPVHRLHDDSVPPFMTAIPKRDVGVQRAEPPFAAKPPETVRTPDLSDQIPIRPEKTVSVAAEPDGEEAAPIRFVGEAFATYIIVEQGNEIILIDKHAAHERVLFENLKRTATVEVQNLLEPVCVRLDRAEYDAVLNAAELMNQAGFQVEDFGNSSVLLRAVPAALAKCDLVQTVQEVAAALLTKGTVQVEALDRIFHTIACKAATKAGFHTTEAEMMTLARRVLLSNDIRYCPHGRPVAFVIKKNDLEKYFGRIQ